MSDRVGKYEVLAPLTAGGMAQLFLGSTAGPGGFRKYVVIKRVLPQAVGDENLERMFLDEARITAAFSHPSIAQVFDLGEDDEGLYVVMEFIAGQNLNQVVYACARQRAVLPLAFSASVVLECAQALHYAHTFRTQAGEAQSVIHRDVAQKNIMVTYDGQVKLLDFGIAKVKNSLSKTRVGTVKGTAGYMSPEQVRGDPIDGRSDVFSLGVVLWEMATGQRLFSAETELEELRLILDAPIREPHLIEPSVPQALTEVVMKALERDADRRFGSARDFARALQSRCADTLFDVESRAEFMKERFADKIASTQALFDSSGTAELDLAIERYRDSGFEPVQPQDERPRTTLSAGKLEPVRASMPSSSKPRGASAARLPKVPVKQAELEKSEEERELDRQIAAAAAADGPLIAEPTLPRRSPLTGLFVVVLLVGVGFATWKLQGSMEAEKVEPTQPLRADPVAIPGLEPVVEPKDPVKPKDGVSTTRKDPVVTPVKKDPPRNHDPHPTTGLTPKGGTGEVTLVLLPHATVVSDGRAVGSGSVVTFSLPAGEHEVLIVGDDGLKRHLTLPVVAGKNKPLKLQVTDIPAQ
jgi:serine/threonine-protein kinase